MRPGAKEGGNLEKKRGGGTLRGGPLNGAQKGIPPSRKLPHHNAHRQSGRGTSHKATRKTKKDDLAEGGGYDLDRVIASFLEE